MSANITLARPYAKAAFEFANEQKAVTVWDDFLQTMAALVKNQDVALVLASPKVDIKQVEEILIAIYERQLPDGKLSEQERNFIRLLGANERFNLLPEIAELFAKQRIEQEKKLVVNITSAFPISTEQKDKFAQVLKIRMQRDVTVAIETDEQIIGGAIIRAGDVVIDGSVKSQLDKMMQTLVA